MNDVAQMAETDSRPSPVAAFVRDSLRPLSLGYLSWLVLAMFAAVTIYYMTRDVGSSSIVPALLLYYLVAAVHVVFRLVHGGRANILRPDIFFLLIYTMFHLAYVTLYALGVAPYLTEVFRFEHTIPAAVFVVNLGLLGFLFGYEIVGIRAAQRTHTLSLTVPARGWCVVGMGVMIIALCMHIAALGVVGIDVFQRYGYTAVQGIGEYTSYGPALALSQSVPFMVIGLVVYLVASAFRYGKLFRSKLALGVIVAFVSIIIFEGDRGPLLQLGLPILLVRHYFVKRIRIRYIALLFVGTLVVFSAIKVVRHVALAPSEMWHDYQSKRQAGNFAWTDPFLEMGFSFAVVNVTCHAVPAQEAYWRGASWGSAAIHVIPFLQGPAAAHGWIRPGPSDWVTTTYWGRNRAGRAFTVAAEGYLNFGFPGAFIEVMLFGLFIRWLTMFFSRSPSAARAVVLFGCLIPSIMVIRNHVALVTNVCTQIMVVALLLSLFLGSERYKQTERVTGAAPDLAG
jgi:hypothetical protein